MGNKGDAVVVAIGLIAIILITMWVIDLNNQCYEQALAAADASNVAVVLQRDTIIRKLAVQARARQEEIDSVRRDLGSARAELETSNKKLATIKAVVQ